MPSATISRDRPAVALRTTCPIGPPLAPFAGPFLAPFAASFLVPPRPEADLPAPDFCVKLGLAYVIGPRATDGRGIGAFIFNLKPC